VNSFEVALLRILVKKHAPVNISTIIEGFPDGNEDSVLAAISSLRHKRYLDVTDYRPDGLISLFKDKRREAVKIVSMGIDLPKDDDIIFPIPFKEHHQHQTSANSNSPLEKNSGEKIQVVNSSNRRRFLPSTTAGKLAIMTVVIVGLLTLVAAGDLPSTSSPAAGSQPAAIHYYYHHHGFHRGSGESNTHGDTFNVMQQVSYDGQKPIVGSSMALKNCIQDGRSSM
jgi:hypothetical protein